MPDHWTQGHLQTYPVLKGSLWYIECNDFNPVSGGLKVRQLVTYVFLTEFDKLSLNFVTVKEVCISS